MNSQHVPSQLASMLGAGHRDAEIYLLRKVLYTHVRPQVAVQILWSLAWCLPVKDLRLPVVVEGITGCDMLFLICPQIIAKHADRRVTSWLRYSCPVHWEEHRDVSSQFENVLASGLFLKVMFSATSRLKGQRWKACFISLAGKLYLRILYLFFPPRDRSKYAAQTLVAHFLKETHNAIYCASRHFWYLPFVSTWMCLCSYRKTILLHVIYLW
jgi:hypothetical protein